MGQTPVKLPNSVTNNAAKDDVVGLNHDFTFTIADLLANDPGGANKLADHFFFGSTNDYTGVDFAHGGIPSVAQQTAYLAAHNITVNAAFTEFTINAGGTDINYMVQIGNKGTWSLANVDVNAPVPHLGGNLFTENFEGYADPAANPLFATANLNVQPAPQAGSPTPIAGWAGGDYAELGAQGYGGIGTTGFWLDTQNSPGGILISHTFDDSTAPVGGKTAVLSFDIAKQSLNYQNVDYKTDPNASFDFKVDGVVVAHAGPDGDAAKGLDTDLWIADQMQHISVDLAYLGTGQHTLTLEDTSPTDGFTGFSIDNIQINDWVI